jgi:hypothetical protein
VTKELAMRAYVIADNGTKTAQNIDKLYNNSTSVIYFSGQKGYKT